MTINELKTQIMHNELSNVYVFTGTELGIQKIYLEQMSKVLNKPIIRADSVLEIYNKCTSRSLFGSTSNFYVIRDDMAIMKEEKVYENLSNEIAENVIVLLYEKIDSRLKFGKFFKDKTVVFEKLAPNVLNAYIKKVCPLSQKGLADLSNKISGSYDLAMMECEKINCYSKVANIDVDRALKHLIETGVIYQPEESSVFEFTDSVLSRQIDMSIQIAQNLLDNGVQVINILGTLYNSLKTVLLIQVCEDSDIAGTTGLDSKQIYFNKKYVRKFPSEKLVQVVKLIARTINDIKNGKVDDVTSLYYIMVSLYEPLRAS